MLNIKTTIVCLCLFAGATSVSAQEPQKPLTMMLGAANTEDDSKAHKLPSESMTKKVREMEKVAAEVKGQDDAALEIIGGKIGETIVMMPLNKDLMAAIKDKRFDWRIRCVLMLHKSYTARESNISKYSDDFTGIMLDKKEEEHVRGMAALMLVNVSAKNAKVNEALKEVAKAPDTPAEVLKAVMAAVGYVGIDDADVLMKLTEREPANFNDIGINLNAVRALGKSKDPRAIGYLIKIFDNSVPDSFYNFSAIEQFWHYIKNPETRELVKPLIIPRFLALLDDRSYLGSSRDEAAAILAELDVKEAVEPILRWYLPADFTHAKVGGGGNRIDVFFGAIALVKLGDKRAIPVLEQTIKTFANDSRWSWTKAPMEKDGQKFPEDHQDYKHLKECLAALKKQK